MKTGLTMRVEEELLERVRNAIWAGGNRTTITEILEDALRHWVEAEEKNKNKNKPFPLREGELPYARKRKLG